ADRPPVSTVSDQKSSPPLRRLLSAAPSDEVNREDNLSLCRVRASTRTEAIVTVVIEIVAPPVAAAAATVPVLGPQAADRLGGHGLDVPVDDGDVEEFGGREVVDAHECRPLAETAAGVDGSLGEGGREGDERARSAAGAEPGGDDVLRAGLVMGIFAHIGTPADVAATGEGRLDALESAGGDDGRRVVADDAEGSVPVVEQLLSGQATGFELVTGHDADSVPADRRVERHNADPRGGRGAGIDVRGVGVGTDDDDSGQVVGEAFVDEGLFTLGVVACH